MLFIRKSPLTGKENTLDLPVTSAQLAEWQSGTPIQRVMPHLTDDEREFLISGYLPGEFEQHLGDADEDNPVVGHDDPNEPAF